MSVAGTGRTLEAEVVTEDGVTLATTVRLPEGAGPWPATVFRSPYGRLNEMIAVTDPGVATVLQDVRGRFDSGGVFDLGGSDGADGAATVAWVAAQPWCDGGVAMHGASYAGMTQLRAASAGPAALRAIAPIRCPAWWRPLTMHEGGALLLSLLTHWLPQQAAQAPDCPDHLRGPIWERSVLFEQIVDYPPGPPTAQGRLNLARALAHPSLRHRPLIEAPLLDAVPAWAEIWRRVVTEPYPHSWLTDPGPPPGSGPRVPTLLLSGWYDCWSQDHVAMFAALRVRDGDGGPHRLVMTPYSHAPEPAGELGPFPDSARFPDSAAVDWNLEWLRDAPSRMRELAPVTWAVMGAGRWDEAPDWPPPGAQPVDLHLDASTPERPLLGIAPAASGQAGFTCDPRNPMPSCGGPSLGLPMGPLDVRALTSPARDDVVSFTTAALAEPLELSGPVTADMVVSVDALDNDVVVRLLDVRADGRCMSVAEGVTRARYRSGPPPRPLAPGVPTEVGVHLWNVAYLLPAGSRLRVDVCGGSFPRIEPNANSGLPAGTDTESDLRPATLRVHSGPAGGSRVRLTARTAEMAQALRAVAR